MHNKIGKYYFCRIFFLHCLKSESDIIEMYIHSIHWCFFIWENAFNSKNENRICKMYKIYLFGNVRSIEIQIFFSFRIRARGRISKTGGLSLLLLKSLNLIYYEKVSLVYGIPGRDLRQISIFMLQFKLQKCFFCKRKTGKDQKKKGAKK